MLPLALPLDPRPAAGLAVGAGARTPSSRPTHVRAELVAHAPEGVVAGQAAVAGPADRAPAALAHLLEEPRRLRACRPRCSWTAAGRRRGRRDRVADAAAAAGRPADELRLRRRAAAAGRGHACRPASPRDALDVKLRADWLVCKDVCIPEVGRLRAERCRRGARPVGHAALFAAARGARCRRRLAGAGHAPRVDGQRARRARSRGLPAAWQRPDADVLRRRPPA